MACLFFRCLFLLNLSSLEGILFLNPVTLVMRM